MTPGPHVRPDKEWIAAVAQMVEQRIRNAWAGGSSPSSGTTFLVTVVMDSGKNAIYRNFFTIFIHYCSLYLLTGRDIWEQEGGAKNRYPPISLTRRGIAL